MPTARIAVAAPYFAVVLLSCTAGGTEAPPLAMAQDTDQDGLCDTTEARDGTDPEEADTDGDGLPDGLERALGYEPQDSTSPTPAQLVGPIDATTEGLRFQIALTVDGDGGGYRGAMIPLSSPIQLGFDAVSLRTDAIAVSAQPPDNVRRVEAKSERFVTVVGPTRLSFELNFRVDDDDFVPCASAHPFGYGVYDDQGIEVDRKYFTLLVGASPGPITAEDFCLPSNCL